MIRMLNPPDVAAPSGYSHAALIDGPHRRMLISGQVGTRPDGTVSEDAPEQIALAFHNLGRVLAAGDMTPTSIVKMTMFLTDAAHIQALRAERTRFCAGNAPASTLLIVAGLANPAFVVEIEAEAVAAV